MQKISYLFFVTLPLFVLVGLVYLGQDFTPAHSGHSATKESVAAEVHLDLTTVVGPEISEVAKTPMVEAEELRTLARAIHKETPTQRSPNYSPALLLRGITRVPVVEVHAVFSGALREVKRFVGAFEDGFRAVPLLGRGNANAQRELQLAVIDGEGAPRD